ncbi:hypothetical protein C0993_009813 [Termitomyces sp. T159_Od127]|nr:hypothetical protein C0993_009813 [Termitomyces sp. T159_Od127]
MLTPTADAFLASTSFIACANLLLAQVQGLGAEAPHNKVERMMRLWQKWRTMWGGGIMWKRDRELLEWCMVHYRDNFGAEWLVLFANDFMPAAPSFDEELEALLVDEEPLVVSMAAKSKEAVIALLVEQDLWQQEEFWQEVIKKSKADVQRRITNSLEALAHEGLSLGEATGAGKGSQQGEKEEKEGAKEKTPDTITGAAMEAARKAPMGGTKRLALPAEKGSSIKLASKRRRHSTPRYKAPTQQDFSDKELACLLVSRQAEAVVDTGVEARVVLKETKGKVTVNLAMCQAFKEEWGAADNNPEGCWYFVDASPCFKCMAMKRLCTLDGAKTCERSNVPDSTVKKTYHWAVLVRKAWAVVKKAREAEAQGNEERGSSKGKGKASLPLSPTDKKKKRARVVSPAAVTPEVESESDEEDKACCLGTAIEASKVAPGVEDLAGSSCQAEAPQDVGALQEEMEQEEEEAKVGLEVAPQVQLWGWESPQWSWLLEWGANDPTTWDVSSGNKPESWEPRRRVTARYNP